MSMLKRSATVRRVTTDKVFADIKEVEAQFDLDLESQEGADWMKQQLDEVQKASNISDPAAVDALVEDRVEKAFQNAVFAESDNELIVLTKGAIESHQVLDKVDKKHAKGAARGAFLFAFAVGSVTETKYWIKVGKSPSNKTVYMSLPDLNEEGRRSHLVHFFRNAISTALDKGYDNKLILAMKRSGHEVPQDRRKCCFPKGHWIEPEHRVEITGDLEKIFKEMGKRDVSKRKFDGLSYFA